MSERPFLYVARRYTKKPIRADGKPFAPIGRRPTKKPRVAHVDGYDRAANVNRTTTGIAASGEISPAGTVSQTEDHEGRVAVEARPATMRAIRDPDGIVRLMTMDEMIAKGYFIVGKGPR